MYFAELTENPNNRRVPADDVDRSFATRKRRRMWEEDGFYLPLFDVVPMKKNKTPPKSIKTGHQSRIPVFHPESTKAGRFSDPSLAERVKKDFLLSVQGL